MIFFGFLANIEWTAQKAGQATGMALVPLALMVGMAKCVQIMRRPTTSKLCVSALLLILSGCFFSSTGNISVKLLALPQPFIVVGGLISVLFMLAGLVIGIVGLATYDRQRFLQGKAQAIWAVVLGGIMGLVFVAGAITSFLTPNRNFSQNGNPAGNNGKPIEKPEFNFSITPPSRWINMKPEAINKQACVAMRRVNPDVYCVIISERLSGSIDMEAFKEVVKSNLASASQVLEQSEESLPLNGLAFTLIKSRVHMDTMNMGLKYEHWLACEHGFAWQIIFWSQNTSKQDISNEARKVIETFHILDPTKDGGGKGNLTDVSRPELGYTTSLEGRGWSTWLEASRPNALMNFGAKRINEELIVVPVRFKTTPPDLDTLISALLTTLNFTYPSDGSYETKSWSPPQGGDGIEITTEREVEGEHFDYVMRVARGKNSAHLIAGWAERKKGDLELVRKSLDAIKLQDVTGVAPAATPAQKTAYGVFLNAAGLSLYQRKDYQEAAVLFQEGFEQTKNDSVILENTGNALELAGKYKEGYEFLSAQVDKFPKNVHLGCRCARLQVLNGDTEAGNEMFLKLVSHGLKNEEDLLEWLSLLNKNEHYPEALKTTEAWVAKNPTVNARRWQAQVIFASGERAKALLQFEKLMEENPKDSKVAYDLGNYCNDAGEHTKAATVAEKLLADGKESPRALMMLGWSQFGRKWYRDAKSTFEQAAKKLPDDDDIKDAIRRSSAMLGQGDNSSIKEPLNVVAIPPEVSRELASASIPKDFGMGHSAAWLVRANGWNFEKNKPIRHTLHRSVKVIDSEGAKNFSSIEVPFNPLNERIYMNRLEVKDAEGKTIAQASLGDAYVRDMDDGNATHRKVLHMQVAGVQPGRVVEWEVTLEDTAVTDAFPFERQLFANSLPVAAEALFITGDVANLKVKSAQNKELKKVNGERLIAWIFSTQSPELDEPSSIWAERRSPIVWLGSDEGDWKKVAKEYIKENLERFHSSKPVDELAASLTVGCKTDQEKIAAISRHVQKDIGYKAIEFGVRARRPNAAEETIKLHYGDCKDTALLLHQLLRSAGIESYLTLVNTDWIIQPALPSLDQFNHMVVNVPALGKNWLLDGTDKSLDLASYPASGLWHSYALVLDDKDPRLISPSGRAPNGTCEVMSRRTITLSGSDWHVEETLSAQGYYASSLRSSFTGLSSDEQVQRAQKILAAQSAAQLQDFRFQHLDDPSQPAQIFLSYTVRNALASGNSARTATLPALWEHYYLSTSFVKDRHTSFEWLYPMHFASELELKFPYMISKESMSAFKQKADSNFCTWNISSETKHQNSSGSLIIRFDFSVKPGEHSAGSYNAFHDSWEAAKRVWDMPISWIEK